MTHRIISTPVAPAAIGPYVQATAHGKLVFTSGQLPLDPATMTVISGGIVEQTEQAMKNLIAVLAGGRAERIHAAGHGSDACGQAD